MMNHGWINPMAWDSLLVEVDFFIGWNRFKTCDKKHENLKQNGRGLHGIDENRMKIGWKNQTSGIWPKQIYGDVFAEESEYLSNQSNLNMEMQ